MHEFSIAEAIATEVNKLAPACRVTAVEVRIGALRGLEAESLRMCWEAATHDTSLAGSQLEVDQRPWTIACADCGRTWESRVPFVPCACGNPAPAPTAGDELQVVSVTVETPERTTA
jgi:hydrogenase nickel incorporation protein HypA/HybF